MKSREARRINSGLQRWDEWRHLTLLDRAKQRVIELHHHNIRETDTDSYLLVVFNMTASRWSSELLCSGKIINSTFNECESCDKIILLKIPPEKFLTNFFHSSTETTESSILLPSCTTRWSSEL